MEKNWANRVARGLPTAGWLKKSFNFSTSRRPNSTPDAFRFIFLRVAKKVTTPTNFKNELVVLRCGRALLHRIPYRLNRFVTGVSFVNTYWNCRLGQSISLRLTFWSAVTVEARKHFTNFYVGHVALVSDFVRQWNPALRPPRYYGHPVITATSFWPGEIALSLLYKNPFNTATS